jgi:hypothetical protein
MRSAAGCAHPAVLPAKTPYLFFLNRAWKFKIYVISLLPFLEFLLKRNGVKTE